MAELTPKPISAFVEVTDLNNFNSDSYITLLDANATNPETKNAKMKFKGLYQLINNSIFPINDSQITTGINPANINTNQLKSISSIQVNQYGRVVSLDGSTDSTDVAVSSVNTGSYNIVATTPSTQWSGVTYLGSPSNFICKYTGNLTITIYYTAITNRPGINFLADSFYMKSNNITQTAVPIVQYSESTYQTANIRSGVTRQFGIATIIVPVSAGDTNFSFGLQYATTTTSMAMTLNVLFSNNAQ